MKMTIRDSSLIAFVHAGSPKVFVLSSPGNLLQKLHWEIANFQRSLGRKNKPGNPVSAYHAFNCAVTAWHMTDWVWEYLAPESQAELAARLRVKRADLRSFQDAIASSSRALNACQEIANGSKHRNVRRKRADPHVRVGGHWAEVKLLPTDRPGSRRFRLTWVIRDQGGTRPALEVFNEAAEYWEDFLSRWLLFPRAGRHRKPTSRGAS